VTAFVPFTDFDQIARCLDDKRLPVGAQRYEAWSILEWIRKPSDYPKLVRAGYCKQRYEDALVLYVKYAMLLVTWAARGKTNALLKPYHKE
jgi:hypothetical protein